MNMIDSEGQRQMEDIFVVVADGSGHRVASRRMIIPTGLMSESLADELANQLNEAVQSCVNPREVPNTVKPVHSLTSIRLVQSKMAINPMNLMDGRYPGSWGGHKVVFSIDDLWYEGNTEAGCRGINEPVTVTISGDQATFAE